MLFIMVMFTYKFTRKYSFNNYQISYNTDNKTRQKIADI